MVGVAGVVGCGRVRGCQVEDPPAGSGSGSGAGLGAGHRVRLGWATQTAELAPPVSRELLLRIYILHASVTRQRPHAAWAAWQRSGSSCRPRA